MVCLASIGKDSFEQNFTELMLMTHDCVDVNGLEDKLWVKNAMGERGLVFADVQLCFVIQC